jgi:hypothetical protein
MGLEIQNLSLPPKPGTPPPENTDYVYVFHKTGVFREEGLKGHAFVILPKVDTNILTFMIRILLC